MNTLLRKFFSARVSRKFWAFGLLYTIVRYRHIGIDIATTGAVPALRGGKVTMVEKTSTMAWVVEVKWGPLYLSYCHLATTGRLPREGADIDPGDVLGDLARNKDKRSQWYGGSLWNGQHLHLVVSTKPRAAIQRVAGAEYFDPAPLIRDTLNLPAERVEQVATTSTAVFAAPSRQAPILERVKRGQVLHIAGPSVKGWARIPWGTGTGYVIASRLVYRNKRVHTPGSRLNYRSGPSTKAAVLGSLAHGTAVTVRGVDGTTDESKWARIRVDGRDVWVSRKYLR